ncbi:uncharacterized protein LOC142491437 isoform X2 [Ascaphus truei]|uniref:uncharacterized protein LOC142491437 isoform X2 n=1 Tax=Ascaphus truei TaxID=8439 RepID=UPI003F59720D
MVGLSAQEKAGCQQLLKLLRTDKLLALAETVTKHTIHVQNREDAINEVLSHSHSATELLKRRNVQHDVIYKYLVMQNIVVLRTSEKLELIQHVLEHWRDPVLGQRPPPVSMLSHKHGKRPVAPSMQPTGGGKMGQLSQAQPVLEVGPGQRSGLTSTSGSWASDCHWAPVVPSYSESLPYRAWSFPAELASPPPNRFLPCQNFTSPAGPLSPPKGPSLPPTWPASPPLDLPLPRRGYSSPVRLSLPASVPPTRPASPPLDLPLPRWACHSPIRPSLPATVPLVCTGSWFRPEVRPNLILHARRRAAPDTTPKIPCGRGLSI